MASEKRVKSGSWVVGHALCCRSRSRVWIPKSDKLSIIKFKQEFLGSKTTRVGNLQAHVNLKMFFLSIPFMLVEKRKKIFWPGEYFSLLFCLFPSNPPVLTLSGYEGGKLKWAVTWKTHSCHQVTIEEPATTYHQNNLVTLFCDYHQSNLIISYPWVTWLTFSVTHHQCNLVTWFPFSVTHHQSNLDTWLTFSVTHHQRNLVTWLPYSVTHHLSNL